MDHEGPRSFGHDAPDEQDQKSSLSLT